MSEYVSKSGNVTARSSMKTSRNLKNRSRTKGFEIEEEPDESLISEDLEDT
jgi:hypothetical protein